MKVIFWGYGGSSHLAEELRPIIHELGMQLVTIHEWDNADVKWKLDTWLNEIKKSDIIVIPIDYKLHPSKSNNRLTQALSIGKPVVCSPLDAYKRIEDKFMQCCLFADSKEQWREQLKKLKDDEELRNRLSQKALEAAKEYSVDAIGNKWLSILPQQKRERAPSVSFAPPPAPVDTSIVDIIIAVYNNREYLEYCIESIRKNTAYPYRLMISDAGSDTKTWDYLHGLRDVVILGEGSKRLNFSQACNAAIVASNAKYFVILNSDVIVSKGWLTNLVKRMNETSRLALCGVLSNCDRGWLHGVTGKPFYPMQVAGIELMPGMKLETLLPYKEALYSFMETSNNTYKDRFVEQEWIAAYAMIGARSAINEVGLFDPRFQNGCEDLDMCRRLKARNYIFGQALDSFVFHFGGVSRAAYESEGCEKYHKEDTENHRMLKEKWSREKVVIWTGPAWEPWNRQKVDNGMAGSETWASYLGRALVKSGYNVTIYNDLLAQDRDHATVLDPVQDNDGNVVGNVSYRNYTNIQDDLRYDLVHYFISSRTTEPLKFQLRALKNYVMVHDIWLSSDKKYDIMADKVNKYAYLSDWHKEYLISHHGMPAEKMFLTANGVDIDNYSDVDSYEKKNQAVYSSSPDRGLYQLLTMLPEIRKQVPDFQLYVVYGFYNWETALKARNDKNTMEFVEKIKSLLKQDGVVYKGRVNKRAMAVLQMESKVWLYPCWFWETFGIGCVENGLSKNALLTTSIAGLKTTVGDAGILLSPDGLSRDAEYPQPYKDNFIQEAVRLLKDESYRKVWADRAYNKMIDYTWDKVAEGWIEQFKR